MGSRPKATCTAPSLPFPSFPQVTLQWFWGQGAWPNSGSIPEPTTQATNSSSSQHQVSQQ